MTKLSHSRLKELLSYNRKTGVFRWRKKRSGIRADRVAGSPDGNGYRQITIDGSRYRTNRLAWLYVTGEWPAGEIDHRNTKPGDDRWVNLREGTHSQNRANGRVNRDSKSGIKGVSVNPRSNCSVPYEARIRVRGKLHYLGGFKTPAEAKAAYNSAAKMHFGEFARA